MGIFAKLFERDGEQALVMKDIHAESQCPAISVCFEMDARGGVQRGAQHKGGRQ